MKIISNCKLLKPVFTTFIVLLLTSVSFAGAWSEKKGGGYYKLSFRYLKGDKIYNSSGDKVAINDFTDLTVGFYGTYGLTDKITISLNASPYKSTKQSFKTENTTFEVSGFGDFGLGVKYGFAKIGKSVFATSFKGWNTDWQNRYRWWTLDR